MPSRPPKSGKSPVKKPKRVLGFSKAEIRAARGAMATQGTGTPRAVIDSFIPAIIKLGETQLQPVSGSIILALQCIGSSFTRSENPSDFPVADIARCLFIFTTPIKRVRQLLGGTLIPVGKRPEAWPQFDAAVEAMCDQLPAAELIFWGPLLNQHIADAFSTAVPYRAKGSGGSDFPQAPASGPGSAGS